MKVSKYFMGLAEGEYEAEGSRIWILCGFLFGILALVAVLFTNPKPKIKKLNEGDDDYSYIRGYMEGFRKRTKIKNAMYALAGWGIWIIIFLGILALSTGGI